MHPTPEPQSAPRLPLLLLALITAMAAAGSLHWVRANVVLMGRDAAGYLGTTLEQYAALQPFSLRALFVAFTSDGYRTPALYLAAQPFLRLFGPTADGAQFLNVLLLAALIPLTWWLARQVAGRWTALYAALLAALLPLLAALGRLFYTEALLTTAVTLNLIALYQCRGFARRGWALVWGASLGAGLLVKWTMPIYVALPLLWVLWGVAHAPRAPHALLLRPRSLLVALAAGLGFAALWYMPNRAAAQEFVLGGWLFVGWLLIAALCTWLLLEGRGPWLHVAGALALGLWIASLWYLPHIDFARTLLATDQERGSTRAGLRALFTYTRYFGYLYREHFGPLATWIIAPLALFPWLRALWRRARWGSTAPAALGSNTALLWLSLLSGYAALALLAQSNARNLAPLLPPLCVLVALAVADYRPPWRYAWAALIVAVLLAQWLAITSDRFAPLYAQRALWVGDQYAMPPASGPTAPALWIAPAIVDTVARGAAQGAAERQEIGMLVNTPWLHRGNLRYVVRQANAPVQIRDLTEADATWPRLLTSPWLLIKDGDNRDVEPAGQALIARTQADPLFARLFAPARTWDLPTGERVTLYERSDGPDFATPPTGAKAQAQTVADTINAHWSDQARVVYTGLDRAAWVSRAGAPALPATLAMDAAGQLEAHALEPLTGTLFVVLEPDAAKAVRRLDQQAYKVAETGGDYVWVSIYGKPAAPPTPAAVEGATWRGQRLTVFATQTTLPPGAVIPLDVAFANADGGLKWSVRLVDSAGSVVATSDRAILATDRFGLLVPPSAPPGPYTLVALAYDPATLAPVPTDSGAAQVTLTQINVQQ